MGNKEEIIFVDNKGNLEYVNVIDKEGRKNAVKRQKEWRKFSQNIYSMASE